ncbi:pyrroline-5-carboxylate reductase [Aurantiacibacter xanthus]|uniref:Pyrroline-5-carboxylate reductase n=1 Tax=Aurantiacibacter xanthus TaxID=1784712 RepID=A0A3A1P568_9SPHN|nr:pyrroline-5-carboxylate reductase [Aurantiacibacter xanthus]RIV87298.1 pyrroline-5-carboxylate reductase [Aurantiacibacter xanthus]
MAFESTLLVGCGNMAGAMLEGWLAAGASPDSFTIVDPARETAPGGIELLRELPTGRTFDAILLGIKPQMLGDLAPQIEPLAGPECTVLSMLAGVELSTLRDKFPRSAAQVRVMPNLAVALGKAPVALAQSGLDEAAQGSLVEWMGALGYAEWVAEDKFDLVTALAGSGPAFVYRFIDALANASVRLGLPEHKAQQFALAMVEGAAALAAQSEHTPGKLADMVASKGGVTRAGLDALDEDEALSHLITKTLRSARDRSVEMAREARNQG